MARFTIDPKQSAVEIAASSSVHPIHSRTKGVEGFIDVEVDGDGLVDVHAEPKGELTLDVAHISSGNPLEDRELRRRIDARRYPTIEGRLTHMHETHEGGRYRVRGELTFRGVTRTCEDLVTFTVVDGDTLRLHGTATFDIRDFGMDPPRILMLRVHPEVTVTLEAVAVKERR